MIDRAKMQALQGLRSGAQRARDPNAPNRDQLMIAIGLGKPVTTPEEDAAIERLGQPAGGQPGSSAPPSAPAGEPDGDEASRMADEMMAGTDLSSLGQVSPALREAGTGGIPPSAAASPDEAAKPGAPKQPGGDMFDSYRRSPSELFGMREAGEPDEDDETR